MSCMNDFLFEHVIFHEHNDNISFEELIKRLKENKCDEVTLEEFIILVGFRDSNQFTEFCQALRQNTSIQTLRMCLNKNVTPNRHRLSYHDFFEAIKYNTTLTSIEIEFSFNEEAVRDFVSVLANNKVLKKLNLIITTKANGVAANIAHALEYNRALTHLELQLTKLCNKDARALAAAIERNTTLTSLNLVSANNFYKKSITILLSALENNRILTKFHIKTRSVDPKIKSEIQKLLVRNTQKYKKKERNEILSGLPTNFPTDLNTLMFLYVGCNKKQKRTIETLQKTPSESKLEDFDDSTEKRESQKIKSDTDPIDKIDSAAWE